MQRSGLGRGWAPASLAALAVLLTPVQAWAQSGSCVFRGTPSALDERPSPLDSVLLDLGEQTALLCYGRPSARGRVVLGGIVPYGLPWRLGANEPTTLHLPVAARVGDVDLGPGSYSLYAIPERDRWTIVVNDRTDRWGIPISGDVRAADIGSFAAATTTVDDYVETFQVRYEPTGVTRGELVVAWERTVVRIPIARR